MEKIKEWKMKFFLLLIVIMTFLLFDVGTKKGISILDKISISKNNKIAEKDSVSCVEGDISRLLVFSWQDSSKNKLGLDITYENKTKSNQIIWLGTWLIALYEDDFEDWFNKGMTSYNRIYITDKTTQVAENLEYGGDFNVCQKVLPPYYINSDLCLQNFKLLNIGECFKISIIVKDSIIANFIKQKQTKISFISNELRINEDDLSFFETSKNKKMDWFQNNHLNFEMNNPTLSCEGKKIHFKYFKITHKKPSIINANVFFNDFSDKFSPIYTETYPNF